MTPADEITPLIKNDSQPKSIDDSNALAVVNNGTYTNSGPGAQYINAGAGYQVNFAGAAEPVLNFNVTLSLILDGLEFDRDKFDDLDHRILLQQVYKKFDTATHGEDSHSAVPWVLTKCCGYRAKQGKAKLDENDHMFHSRSSVRSTKQRRQDAKAVTEDVAASVVAEVGPVLQDPSTARENQRLLMQELAVGRLTAERQSRKFPDDAEIQLAKKPDATNLEYADPAEPEVVCGLLKSSASCGVSQKAGPKFDQQPRSLQEVRKRPAFISLPRCIRSMDWQVKDGKTFYVAGRIFEVRYASHNRRSGKHAQFDLQRQVVAAVWNRDGYCWCVHVYPMPSRLATITASSTTCAVRDIGLPLADSIRFDSIVFEFGLPAIAIDTRSDIQIGHSLIDFERPLIVPWTSTVAAIGYVVGRDMPLFEAATRAGLLGQRAGFRTEKEKWCRYTRLLPMSDQAYSQMTSSTPKTPLLKRGASLML